MLQRFIMLFEKTPCAIIYNIYQKETQTPLNIIIFGRLLLHLSVRHGNKHCIHVELHIGNLCLHFLRH